MTAEIQVRAEQVRTLYRQGTAVVVSSLVVSLIVTAVLWSSVPPLLLLALPGGLALVAIARLMLHRRYFRDDPPAPEGAKWGRRFALGSACSGVLWGAASFALLGAPEPPASLVIPFAVGGLSAAAAGTVSCHLPAFFAFVVPALAGVLARALAVGDASHLGLAAMIAVYGPALSYIAIVSHRALREALRLRFENEALLVELEAARARLEENNRTLERRVEERSRELARKADALRDAQRLEAVGRLAGGVAHDFNNLLMVVLGNVNDLLVKQERTNVPEGRLLEIREAAERGAELVKQLLLFGRRQPSRPETLDMNHVVTAMQRLLVRLIGEHLTLDVTLSKTPLYVHIDRAQLEQVVVNLVTNARDAMSSGGTVRVETAGVDLEGMQDGVAAGSYARLVVADTGAGMDSETRRRLFEPFFTTKDVGRGTGLGLATVHGIVEEWGGAIQVESEARRGSRFSIYFPRLAAAGETAGPAPPPASNVPRSTILLVEDDASVRRVTSRMLARAGHRVLLADSPEHALALAREYPDPIDLLLTDVVMPGLSGPDLSERLRELRPALRTLFMSGYDRGLLASAEENSGTQFLEKPFTYEALLAKVAVLVSPSVAAPDGDVAERKLG